MISLILKKEKERTTHVSLATLLPSSELPSVEDSSVALEKCERSAWLLSVEVQSLLRDEVFHVQCLHLAPNL